MNFYVSQRMTFSDKTETNTLKLLLWPFSLKKYAHLAGVKIHKVQNKQKNRPELKHAPHP